MMPDELQIPSLPKRVGRAMIALCSIGVVASVDYTTGTEISFSIFYLAPIAWVAWTSHRWDAWAMAVLGAAAWHAAERYGGMAYSHPAIPLWNTLVRLAFYVICVESLSRLRAAVRVSRQLARTDSVTGLANARAFREAVRAELERSKRYPSPTTVVYLDVDHFKTVNDTHGHDEGDRVLSCIGRAMRTCLRRVDVSARLGGDEFAILLPEAGTTAARGAMTKLLNQLAAHTKERRWPISFSVGVATFTEPPASSEELISRADQLMYAVKKDGRNGIRYGEY